MTRRVLIRVVAVAIAIGLAIVGIVPYTRDPDVDTYWLSGLLILPLALIVLYAMRRLLPVRVQWIAAIVLAPLGGIAYLLWPNDQWWNFGAMTAMPLMFLAARRDADAPAEPPAAGMTDGPWGPP